MVAIGRSRTCATALVAAALSTALVAPGCASPSGRAHRAPSATGSTPYVTGLGSTLAVWNAHHSAAGATVLTDPRGRVDGYVLFVPPEPLAEAIARVRADLPPDATAGAPEPAEGVEGTKCAIVEFRSETLGRMLGNDGGRRQRQGHGRIRNGGSHHHGHREHCADHGGVGTRTATAPVLIAPPSGRDVYTLHVHPNGLINLYWGVG